MAETKFFFCFFLLFGFHVAVAQNIRSDSCLDFTLLIDAQHLQADSIRILYNDCDGLENSRKIFSVRDGKAVFRGKINRATEALLFTNIKSRWMDGPGVIRFIIEPGEIAMSFTMKRDSVLNVAIGGNAQQEKMKWELDNASVLVLSERYRDKISELHRQLENTPNPQLEEELTIARHKFDALRELLMVEVLKQIWKNPASYYSGYLMDYYKASIPTDTLTLYFSRLDYKVISSDFGKFILDALLKRTDDQVFKKKFLPPEVYKKLENVQSIYEVALTNLNGAQTKLSDFKGNFLLIDFWASWCSPCIRNAPYLLQLIKDMEGEPVQFLSVSIDRDIPTWKQSIIKHSFPGIHLFDEHGVLSFFLKAIWVPTYVIIDPDGNILNADAPHPNGPELKELLNNYLKEKRK